MKRVWFKRNDETVPVWTSTDGKVDFKALGRRFLLNPETITLNGDTFPLDSTGKSDASWMQIKDALGVAGTEKDPVRVHGNPGHASEPVAEVVKQVSLRLGCIEQSLVKQEQTVVKRLEELRLQLDTSSSSMASMSDVDKGIRVSKSTVRLIMPKPLSGEEAEGLWPEVCWKNLKRLSPEKYFKELLSGLIDDASTCWKIKFTGSSPSVCGPVLKPDVLIYKRPPSAGVDPIPLTTGVILELQSGGGKYNSYFNIGKAARYGENMLKSLMGFRRSVLVGVTDLEMVQWFKVIMEDKKRFTYEMHVELNDVRGSLCALLKSSLSDLEVELPVLTVSGVEYEPIRFLGSGATSNVLCVKDEDYREYAAKIPLHGKNLQNDYGMLTCLNDVEGVPKVLGWFDDDKSLRIHPVGERISHKSISSRWALVPGLVDVLERAHEHGIINRDVRPDNIMIAKGESEETEMLYILDWGYAVTKKKSSCFSGGVMYASERILEQLAGGDHQVVVDERDDTEALVHTIFALRYREKHKMLRGLDRQDFDEIRRFWSECYDEYPGWQSAWTAARSGGLCRTEKGTSEDGPQFLFIIVTGASAHKNDAIKPVVLAAMYWKFPPSTWKILQHVLPY